MNECRRKSAHSSSESLNHLNNHTQQHGFISKLITDIRKLYIYDPCGRKWMNEKPKHRKAYEPTEVIYWFFLDDRITSRSLHVYRKKLLGFSYLSRCSIDLYCLFLDWTYREHNNAWILDSSCYLCRIPSSFSRKTSFKF